MGSLFGGKTETPDPEPPAPMPDPEDPLAKRKRRQQGGTLAKPSSMAGNTLAPLPGTMGREYSRQTLG